METHDEPAGQGSEAVRQSEVVEQTRIECAMPSLTESLLALGLLIVTIIGCCLIYGPAIRMMPVYIHQVLSR